MTPSRPGRFLVVSLLVASMACGQGELLIDQTGDVLSADEAGLDDPQTDQSGNAEASTESDQTTGESSECGRGTIRFVGWQTRIDVRRGAIQEEAPQLISSDFMVTGVVNTPHVNNTANPIQVQSGGSVCVTSMGSVSVTASVTTTITSTISVPGASIAAGTAVMAGVAVTQSVSTCMESSCHQQHTLQPGDKLFCSTFQGMEKSTYRVKRYQEVTRVTQHRKVYERLTICVPGGPVYGPWIDGSTTVMREDLEPLTIETTLPFVKTVCQAGSYPVSP